MQRDLDETLAHRKVVFPAQLSITSPWNMVIRYEVRKVADGEKYASTRCASALDQQPGALNEICPRI